MKLPASSLTSVALGDRFTQKQALDAGIIHEIIDVSKGPQALLDRAVEIGVAEAPKTSWGVWGVIKEQMYRTIIAASAIPRAPRSAEIDEVFWARVKRQDLDARVKGKL